MRKQLIIFFLLSLIFYNCCFTIETFRTKRDNNQYKSVKMNDYLMAETYKPGINRGLIKYGWDKLNNTLDMSNKDIDCNKLESGNSDPMCGTYITKDGGNISVLNYNNEALDDYRALDSPATTNDNKPFFDKNVKNQPHYPLDDGIYKMNNVYTSNNHNMKANIKKTKGSYRELLHTLPLKKSGANTYDTKYDITPYKDYFNDDDFVHAIDSENHVNYKITDSGEQISVLSKDPPDTLNLNIFKSWKYTPKNIKTIQIESAGASSPPVGNSSDGYLHVAGFEVYNKDNNTVPIPLKDGYNCSVSQSSTFAGGVAANAIKNVNNYNFGSGGVSHTNNVGGRGVDGKQNWIITFNNPLNVLDIDRIVIHNRSDCCGFRLLNATVTMYDDKLKLISSKVLTKLPPLPTDPITIFPR